MPILEFYSPDTHTIYQFLARTLSDAEKTPRCPAGVDHRMEKLVSAFAITGRAKEKSENAPGEGGEEFSPEQEAALMRLTSQMEGISDENPDPQLDGRLMREMTGILGKEKMPENMDEMIRRLEGGENLEKLEEEFGDLMGDDDAGAGGDETDSPIKAARRRALGQRQKPARRDPTLYELRDFL